MCFSAAASLSAGVALTAAGAVSVSRVRRRGQLLFAATPWLFAAQQFAEALLWRGVTRGARWRMDSPLVSAYLFFALFLWPAHIPLATAALERRPQRRAAILALALPGLVLGCYLYQRAIAAHACAFRAAQHLYYTLGQPVQARPALNAAYVLTTVAPLMLSTARGAPLFGAAMAGTYTVAAAYFRTNLVSVWCFFAALLSAGVAAIVAHDARSARAPRAA